LIRAPRDDKLTPEVAEKINWMKQKVDWYDPLINQENEILAELNKDTLKFNRALFSYWF
jgi:hypothetical protein